MAIFNKYNLSIIAKAVDLLYEGALDSEELAPYFKKVNMQQLRNHQVELISHVMGGPVTHRVETLQSAHQNLNIPSAHFDLIATLLQQSLSDVGIEERDIKHIMGVVETTRNRIVKVY
jgi:truncated hemoglobin YjbI